MSTEINSGWLGVLFRSLGGSYQTCEPYTPPEVRNLDIESRSPSSLFQALGDAQNSGFLAGWAKVEREWADWERRRRVYVGRVRGRRVTMVDRMCPRDPKGPPTPSPGPWTRPWGLLGQGMGVGSVFGHK